MMDKPETYYYYNALSPEDGSGTLDDTCIDLPIGEIMELGVVQELPRRWAAHVVRTLTEDGDADDVEIVLFDTEAEAEAAAKARPYVPHANIDAGAPR